MKNIVVECPDNVKNCLVNIDSFSKLSHVSSELVYSDNEVPLPLMSILMPTFNASFVVDALASAVHQKDAPEYEIIVVDNHSDEVVLNKLVEAAKSFHSKRISIYRNSENLGMYGNWNRCIELSRANYFTYLHSDDLLTETCLRDLWNCHLGIETDAAIVTLERVTEMDGTLLSQDRLVGKKLGGLLRPKKQNKRKKIQLLYPHGNGCGHFFSKKVMEEIGGFSSSGDQGGILRYNLAHPVYDLYTITRIKRVGKNESMNVAAQFVPFGYYMRQQVIESFFCNSRILHYLSRLDAEGTSYSMYGVKPLRVLAPYEKFYLKLFKKYIQLISRYEIM